MESKILLIVDDDDGVREALRSVIEFLYEEHVHNGELDVLTAADGEEAVAACRTAMPALILMDVNMPGMDGIEAYYTIRDLCSGSKQGTTAETVRSRDTTDATIGTRPVNTVFLTGHAGSGGVRHRLEQAIEDGAHGYIFKPAMAADLKKTIDRFLSLGPEAGTQPRPEEIDPVDESEARQDSGILGE